MQIIPITNAASQVFNILLADQDVDIKIYMNATGLFMDLYLEKQLLLGGIRCQNMNRIVRDDYFGFIGDLMFMDLQGDEDPKYVKGSNDLGTRYELLYLENSDLHALVGGGGSAGAGSPSPPIPPVPPSNALPVSTSFVLAMDTVVDIRNIDTKASVASGLLLRAKGYYSSDGRGGGDFYYDGSDTATPDNGATIIVDKNNRRWKRVVPASGLTPCMAGCVGDGANDDGTQLLVYQSLVEGNGWTNDINVNYRTTKALSPKVREYFGNGSTIQFDIPNHTDNCFFIRPVVALAEDQEASRYTYRDLRLVGNSSGLDLLYIEDGSPIFYNLLLDSSYRDAMHLHPHGATMQAVENLTIYNLLIRNAGRNPIHGYLDSDGGSNPVYINETNIYGFEIRGMGVHFAGVNAMRFTHSNVKRDYNKIGHLAVYGGNWDAGQANSPGAAGPAVYADVINGSTIWIMEYISLDLGGIEDTSAYTTSPMLPIMDSSDTNYTIGMYRLCEIRNITFFNWVFDVPDVWLARQYGNRFFGPSDYPLPAQNLLAIKSDWDDNIAIRPAGRIVTTPSGDQVVNPYISSDFQNGPCVYVEEIALVASTIVTVDIPIKDVKLGDAIDNLQWPIKVIIDHSSFPDDDADNFGQFGEYLVRCGWRKSPGGGSLGPHAVMEVLTAIPGTTPDGGFDPATGVTFTVESRNAGATYDILRVHIACGSTVGFAGSNIISQIAASRFGLPVLNENNRHGPPTIQVYQRL